MVEFSSLYVFHLRGNQRSAGELSRKEGGKIFGGGSRAPIAISVFVKNPEAAHRGRISYHDIGDYLTREEKLKLIADLGSINGLTTQERWTDIVPDDHDDWLYGLTAHEYTHILHLDTMSGLPNIYNRIFGKTWAPNQVMPRWVIEGIAVYEESKRSSGGRNRGTRFDQFIRISRHAGKDMRIDQISGAPRQFFATLKVGI